MIWRNKIEQLVGLLKNVPQPKVYDSKEGVYKPYFVIELRAGNWEIIPYADYTRLDGSSGRDVRLSLSVLDSSKVNISQEELNILFFLQSNSISSRQIFTYSQPIGFLLNWLKKSKVFIKDPNHKSHVSVSFFPETVKIVLRLIKKKSGFQLQPSLSLSDSLIDIEKSAIILSSNPMYLLYDEVLYKIDSSLPAIFWSNYFRVQQGIEIPLDDVDNFIRIYLPHILPVLDWKTLTEHFEQISLPINQKLITLAEENSHLLMDVKFRYGKYEFPIYLPTDRSLVSENDRLFIVRRDLETEKKGKAYLEEFGLIYRAGNWHIASDYYALDWMRNVLPQLKKEGFEIQGEEDLIRCRVHRQKVRLKLKVRYHDNHLEVKYGLFMGNKALEIPSLLRQIQTGKQYLRLSDNTHIYFPDQLREKVIKFSVLMDINRGSGKVKLPVAGVIILKELDVIAEDVIYDDRSSDLIKRYEQFEKIQKLPPPSMLKGKLRDYQQAGLEWLAFLNDFHFGGILADDMGLGKTVQVISLLLTLKQKDLLKKPVLVIVPLTILYNWVEEIQKFGPSIEVLVYYGSRAERIKLLEKFSEFDVILCSYGIILQDQHSFTDKQFSYIVLDESQKVKNPETKTYRAINKIKGLNKLALTGTPIENSLVDLWSQINFLNPGLLGPLKQFQLRYIDIPPEEQEEKTKALRRLIYPFMLRRKKEEVETELPPLTEVVHHVEMTERQHQIYQKWLRHYREEIFQKVDSDGINRSQMKILEALTCLRQLACHPAILYNDLSLMESGKFLLLDDMLAGIITKGHKVLIFSQFVRFLNLVRKIFDGTTWKYEYLDGKVRNRAQRIKNFQKNQKISAFLISLKAGGVGVNLTAADYVIHLDPWWNPAVEQQATDRAHRIGQDKRVFVYKYIVKNSVEEKILELQQRKKQLSDQLITSDNGFVKHLTREDLEILFSENI
jgi:non-specific serine/threonine protein kinase